MKNNTNSIIKELKAIKSLYDYAKHNSSNIDYSNFIIKYDEKKTEVDSKLSRISSSLVCA